MGCSWQGLQHQPLRECYSRDFLSVKLSNLPRGHGHSDKDNVWVMCAGLVHYGAAQQSPLPSISPPQ